MTRLTLAMDLMWKSDGSSCSSHFVVSALAAIKPAARWLPALIFSSSRSADFTSVAILGQFKDESATNSVERVLKKIATAKAADILRVSFATLDARAC